MRTKPFRVLCADPPWAFGDKLPGGGRGAVKHYATMKTEEICGFQLPPIADDALLFLWRVAAMQEDALRVMSAWGFTQKSEVVWVKTHEPPVAGRTFEEEWVEKEAAGYQYGVDALEQVRFGWEIARGEHAPNRLDLPSGRLAFGMGRYVRQSHEVCLIGCRGKPGATVIDRGVPSVLFAERQLHSQKPEVFYDLVEKLARGPYCELFARRPREGWTCKGDEL